MFNYYLDAFRVNYSNFDGRARRSEFWYFTLFSTLASLVFTALGDTIGTILGGIYSLVALVPSLAIVVRRLHDTGKSGWYYFLVVIPIIGWIWIFILLVTDSQPGENIYGPNPKGIGNNFNDDSLIHSIGQS